MADKFDINEWMDEIRYNHYLNESITVAKLIDDVENGDIVLPVNHRKFSWSAEQIEKFFGGLVTSYGVTNIFTSFILWHLYGDNVKNQELKFCKVIKNYPAESPQIFSVKLNEDNYYHTLQGVWDGQQRITALYIGLKGSYEGKKLYLNLSERVGYERETSAFTSYGNLRMFKFLNIEEADSNWFEIGKILTNCSKDYPEDDVIAPSLFDFERAFKKERIVNLQIERFFDLEKFL